MMFDIEKQEEFLVLRKDWLD